jgi:hypothetical protein
LPCSILFFAAEKYYDALVCQDAGKLPLTCPKNQVISTSNAFFGRGDLNTTCPSATKTPTDNCTADYSAAVFQYLCDGKFNQLRTFHQALTVIAGKRDCEIEANTDLFGDPCPDSRKYLSATYTCEGAIL